MTVKELLDITSVKIEKVKVINQEDNTLIEIIDTWTILNEKIESKHLSIYKTLNEEVKMIIGAYRNILEVKI